MANEMLITQEIGEQLKPLSNNFRAKPVQAIKMVCPFSINGAAFEKEDYLVFLENGKLVGMRNDNFEASYQQIKRNRKPNDNSSNNKK